MIKQNILFVGIGQAGNNMLNEILEKDSKYLGLFVNSSYSDMSALSHFKKENAFLLSTNQSGSGKNRSNAKAFVKDQVETLVDRVTRYPLQDTVVVITSADGGTGSGTTPLFCKLLKDACPYKNINLISIMPNCRNNDRVAFENTISYWNEINKLIDMNVFNDIKLVDNTKGSSYKEINERVASAINDAYSMQGKHTEGNIDDNDSSTFNTAKGFSFVLRLEKAENTKKAIDDAINNCIFALPNTYGCDYLGVSINEEMFDMNDILESFNEVYTTTYKTYTDKNRGTVVLSGCDVPSEVIENIRISLENINNKAKDRVINRNYSVDTEIKPRTKPTTNAHKEPIVEITEEKMKDIIEGLDFLFD